MTYQITAKAGKDHVVVETVNSMPELQTWLTLYKKNGFKIVRIRNVTRAKKVVR